jgi:hypothetical protein
MRKILMLGAALVAVSSCAEDYILHGNARLEPVDDSGFRYIVGTNASSERDDPDAEAVRLRWIGEAVAGNDLCGHGYDIVASTHPDAPYPRLLRDDLAGRRPGAQRLELRMRPAILSRQLRRRRGALQEDLPQRAERR